MASPICLSGGHFASCALREAPHAGKQIFQEALAAGHMHGFFKLIQQFTTQAEPAFCGVSSLVQVMNAMEVDPKRIWKGAWRWYSEDMLDCCKPLHEIERVRARVITVSDVHCVMTRARQRRPCARTSAASMPGSAAVQRWPQALPWAAARGVQEGVTLDQAACLGSCNGANVQMLRHGAFALAEFRRDVERATAGSGEHLVVSYSRKAFQQTGDGHFSPVGGYHPGRELVLILDTARFKYPPHWVPLRMLFDAMAAPDAATGARPSCICRSLHSRWQSLMQTPRARPQSQLSRCAADPPQPARSQA